MQEIIADRRIRIVISVSLVATLFGCALIVAVAQLNGLDATTLTGDARGYVQLARNLLDHQVFSIASEAPFYPESFRSPGYPIFLALLLAVFQIPLLTLFVHAAITSIAPVFLYVYARRFHERAAFWAAILFAFEPVRIFLSASFLSDAFFTILFLLSLIFLEKVRAELSWRYSVLAGGTLGLMILVRPIAIFLPVLYALYLLFSTSFTKSVRYAAVVGILSLIVVFPWMYRNYETFGSWSISSVGPANLVLYNAPEFLKFHPNMRGQEVLDAFRAEYEALPRSEALSLSRSSVFIDTFREVIRGNELSYILFHVLKTAPFFVTDGLRDTVRLIGIEIGHMPNISTALLKGDIRALLGYLKEGGLPITLLVVGSSFWGVVTLFFGVEGIRALVRRDLPIIFITLLIGYFALLTGPVSNARYRVPVEGLIIASAAVLLFRWHDSRLMASKEQTFFA